MIVRRLKTYAASQGYVYQYYFVGSRPALVPPGPAGHEYVFDVMDRKATFAVSVSLANGALRDWAAAHGRELTAAEQYAAAKLCLMRGFDEIEDMRKDGRSLRLDSHLLEELLSGLGIE